jgi:hypothetical protein
VRRIGDKTIVDDHAIFNLINVQSINMYVGHGSSSNFICYHQTSGEMWLEDNIILARKMHYYHAFKDMLIFGGQVTVGKA